MVVELGGVLSHHERAMTASDPGNPPLNIRPLAERRNLVQKEDFAKVLPPVEGFLGWFEALPDIYGSKSLKRVVDAIVTARQNGREVGMSLGAHVLKVGAGLLIVRFSFFECFLGHLLCITSLQELNQIGTVSAHITFGHFNFLAWAFAKYRVIVCLNLNVNLLLLGWLNRRFFDDNILLLDHDLHFLVFNSRWLFHQSEFGVFFFLWFRIGLLTGSSVGIVCLINVC